MVVVAGVQDVRLLSDVDPELMMNDAASTASGRSTKRSGKATAVPIWFALRKLFWYVGAILDKTSGHSISCDKKVWHYIRVTSGHHLFIECHTPVLADYLGSCQGTRMPAQMTCAPYYPVLHLPHFMVQCPSQQPLWVCAVPSP